MARTSVAPQVKPETKHLLITYARGQKVERRMALRSQIVLDWIEGLSYKQSARENKVSEMVIAKWRKRFKKDGLEGLRDARRSGKPAAYTEEDKKRVIHLACCKPDNGKNRYSQKDIAGQTGISQSHVSNILREAEIKPHKTEYWCGISPDPEFEKKMTEIVGLYLNPPAKSLVISVDEKTQIQALDRTQPELPLKKGKVRRLTNTYKRNGTVNLMAALAVHSGEVIAQPVESNNAETFLKFLKKLDRKYRNVELHIIMDNLQVHKTKEVKEWFAKKNKFHAHYTPTYSSWLNQIEIWFGILTRSVLKDAVWRSKQELVEQLITYIDHYNNNEAKPFEWTYGKEKIGLN